MVKLIFPYLVSIVNDDDEWRSIHICDVRDEHGLQCQSIVRQPFLTIQCLEKFEILHFTLALYCYLYNITL